MPTNITIFYIAYFLVILSIGIFGYIHLFNYKTSLLTKRNNTGERFASQSKPIIGGIMFFVCTILGCIVGIIINPNDISLFSNISLIICCILAFGMGCIDDLKNFSPLFKLIFQLICTAILILCDTHIQTSDNIFLNYLLTLLWVVGIMNSINMLDNMDGVTASTTTIILIGLLGLSSNFSFDSFVLLATIASLIAFLFWNWYPSKMYMGDNGSQLLGIILAYFSIKYVWNSNNSIEGINYEQLLFIILMFLVPITDTTTVAINRFLAGRSPFVGDRYHTTHCLVYKGLTIPQTVILLDIITIIGTAITWYFIDIKHSEISFTISIILLAYASIFFSIAYIINLVIRKKNNLLYKNE